MFVRLLPTFVCSTQIKCRPYTRKLKARQNSFPQHLDDMLSQKWTGFLHLILQRTKLCTPFALYYSMMLFSSPGSGVDTTLPTAVSLSRSDVGHWPKCSFWIRKTQPVS